MWLLVSADMAKSNPRPWVTVAAFCEKLLLEGDGVPSAIRIVDTYTIPPLPPEAPKEAVATILVQGLVSLRSGDATGTKVIRIFMENPLGQRTELSPKDGWQSEFTGGEQGINLQLKFALGVRNYGLCWFDVLCDDELLTRIPLKLQQDQTPEAKTA